MQEEKQNGKGKKNNANTLDCKSMFCQSQHHQTEINVSECHYFSSHDWEFLTLIPDSTRPSFRVDQETIRRYGTMIAQPDIMVIKKDILHWPHVDTGR